MTFQGWLLIAVFVGILLLLTKPMGRWLFALYDGQRTPLHRILGPVETGFYRLSGIDPNEEQGWRRYAVHMLIFNVALLLFTYAVLRLQGVLPLNPLGYEGVGADGAFNTAISFTTNTNWQWYSGEATLSILSQMLGLTIHNFLSAATGIALAFAFFLALVFFLGRRFGLWRLVGGGNSDFTARRGLSTGGCGHFSCFRDDPGR